MKKYLQKLGKESKKATLKKIDTKTKNKVLLKFSYLLKKNSNKVLRQNKKEIKFAKLKNISAGFIIYALLVIMGILLWPYASTSKKNYLDVSSISK